MGSAQPHLARGISRAPNSTKWPRDTREMAEGWMRRSWAVATFQTHPTCPTAGPVWLRPPSHLPCAFGGILVTWDMG